MAKMISTISKKNEKVTKSKMTPKLKTCSSSDDESDNYCTLSDDSGSCSDDDESESESDDDNDDDDDDEQTDSDSDGNEHDDEDKIDRKKFHTLLGDIFPSKYMKKKIEKDVKSKTSNDDEKIKTSGKKKISLEDDDGNIKKTFSKKSNSTDDEPKIRNIRRKLDLSDENNDNQDEDKKKRDFNLILTNFGDDDDNYLDEDEEIEKNLNEDIECNSDDEEIFMREKFLQIDDSSKITKKKVVKIKTEIDVNSKYSKLIQLKSNLLKNLSEEPKSKILRSAIQKCKNAINKLVKTSRTNNAKEYYKLTKSEPDSTVCEIDYFKKKMSNSEQKMIMNELSSINKHINIDKPYRLSLLQSNIPVIFKATVLQKLNILKTIEPGGSEYHKLKNWIDTFMKVPFNIYRSLSVNMNDGKAACNEYMINAKNTLDNCVYGLDDAKLQILQMIGQWITNPSAMGTAIAIHGPPGSGKTSIVKEGISKILGREFAFIALGGAGDSSFLEGHSYTYEGSTWGKIVQILLDSKCMNPVIYFDELDKISDSSRGQEIASVLTHLTDTTQNNQFQDKYFTEIDFDLSKCLFIFSYNDESKVSPILKDRMYRIQTKGYDAKEKIIIAKKYLLPKIREQVNFKEGDIIIPDDVIEYVITNPKFTQNEEGVRNLKRCIEIIHTKLNLFRLVEDNNILGKELNFKVEFPFTVTKNIVDILIKNEEKQNQSLLSMYV
jgi:ATP-dependent Lon protease